MKFALIITKEAKDDLRHIWQTDPDAAVAAALLIEELQSSPGMLEELSVPANHYAFDPPFEIKRYRAAFARGYNILILKFRTRDGALPDYRLLIGYHAQEGKYYVLQAPHRDFDYDCTSAEFAELCHRYEQCEIPLYR